VSAPTVVLVHGAFADASSWNDVIERLPSWAVVARGDKAAGTDLTRSMEASKFSSEYSHRTIARGIGHNLPQEAPEPFAHAVLEVGRVRV
jgi:pimeloyl-ACP methyl ester carboxylesterase